MKKTILLAIVFVGVLVLSVGYSDSRYRTAIGRTVPSVVLPSASGDVDLGALRGHYVLLNFWKSTDAPSRRSINDYTAWLRRHPSSDVRLVSVNLDETPQMFREISRRDSLMPSTQFYVGGDTAAAITSTFGLSDGLGTMLISPDGKIIAHNPTPDRLAELVR